MSTSEYELFALLTELIELTILDEGSPQSFRARAYQRALSTLRDSDADLASASQAELTALDGVGAATAKKVREYFQTGTIDKLERLRADFPAGVRELARIPGLGPKTLIRLREELGIESVADLSAAVASGAVASLSGLGEKFASRMSTGIERLEEAGKQSRVPLSRALPLAEAIVAEVGELAGVAAVDYCGSARRLVPEVADVDVLIGTAEAEQVAGALADLSMIHEIERGAEGMVTGRSVHGVQVDFRLVPPEHYGAALVHFTGSAAHNVGLRHLARERGWKLSEYGLEGEGAPAVASEAAVYQALGLEVIPPPMREDVGELAAVASAAAAAGAAADGLPDVPGEGDVRGDLHLHSTFSGDGRSSLEEMVLAAIERGFEYLAVTDHGENLPTNGVSRDDLARQREEIERLRAAHTELTILQGVELNIAADGSLDYDAELRGSLDWCVAAIHSDFGLDRAVQTRRIIAAMEDPSVNAIGHLVGRKIGRRPGVSIDETAVLEAAARTGTAIEINSALARLDADAELLRRFRDSGVTVLINTDAHHHTEYDRLRWGVRHAQRGWVDKERIPNTWPRQRFMDWVQAHRP